MKIELIDLTFRDLVAGYSDDGKEVIRTILRGFPPNVMYWWQQEDGRFDIIDGQRRAIANATARNHQNSAKAIA